MQVKCLRVGAGEMRVGVAWVADRAGGVGWLKKEGQYWVVEPLKRKTWTTGEQQAHVHIHHKTSTILYINIWTSSPGGREGKGWGGGGWREVMEV